jgi:hypothetical protein
MLNFPGVLSITPYHVTESLWRPSLVQNGEGGGAQEQHA